MNHAANQAAPRHARRRTSLTRQLLLLAVLPALLAAMGTAAVLTRRYLDDVSELVRANAQSVALQLAASGQGPMARMDRRALLRLTQSGIFQPYVQRIEFWSDDGEILASAQAAGNMPAVGAQVIVPVLDDAGAVNGRLMVELGREPLDKARRAIWFNVALILAACFFSVALAAAWAVRRIHSPIRELVGAMDRMSAGAPVQLALRGPVEIQRLQTGVNQAAQTLSENQRQLTARIEQATAELALKNHQLELASQAKTRLFAAASHDLRQPLHALTLFSDGLAHGETQPARLTHINHIRACVQSLDRLLSELLNLSQLDAGVIQPRWSRFALDLLFDDISRTFRAVAEQRGLRLVVRKTEAWVNSDYVMLQRILSNLVSNALRHTPTGGVLVASRQRQGQLWIEVHDTGVGIAAEHHAQIFEEFYQVPLQVGDVIHEKRGMGLGLSTVERLAQLLKSQIQLLSHPGKGTCLRISVEPAAPHSTAAPPPLPTPDQPLRGYTVLVIDDEPTILEGLQVVLSRWGANVLVAPGRAQALALADGWHQPPDLVMTDLVLGNQDSSLEVLAALEQHPRGILPASPRLVVTGETHPQQLAAVTAAGVAILFKPVAPAQLLDALQHQLAQGQRPHRTSCTKGVSLRQGE